MGAHQGPVASRVPQALRYATPLKMWLPKVGRVRLRDTLSCPHPKRGQTAMVSSEILLVGDQERSIRHHMPRIRNAVNNNNHNNRTQLVLCTGLGYQCSRCCCLLVISDSKKSLMDQHQIIYKTPCTPAPPPCRSTAGVGHTRNWDV